MDDPLSICWEKNWIIIGKVVFIGFNEKYMVFETHITEIWVLSSNKKNIIDFMHYLLFIF